MKKILILSILAIATTSLLGQVSDFEKRLFELPDVIFEKSQDLENGTAYELRIKQPLDHDDHSKGHFYQKAYLHHVDYDKPTVIVTEGYSCYRHRAYEITDMLNANQIQVEHRFFGKSMPDSLEYQYLNITQATADYHHIRQLFDQIYTGKWISTGISKGGATTIFYKYLHPEDVDVSMPYVAPINDEYEEDRIYEFLNTVGTAECRAKLYEVQKRLLENRTSILPLVKFYTKGAGAKFSYLAFEQAFEFSILEYPFSFWQWGGDCATIPDNTVNLDSTLSHFLAVSDITFFGDKAMETYASHYYQSAEEFGYYGYETEPFKGLLKTFPEGKNPHAAFTPDHMEVPFNGKLLKSLNKWLKKKGNNMIYIYGANDTWSASAVPPSDKVNSVWFMMKDKSHGDARIKNMTEAEKQKLHTTLSEWLDMDIPSE